MRAVFITTIAFCLFALTCNAQWATLGSNIYNTNAGYVGIGTNNPTAALQIGNFLNGGSFNQIVIPGTYNFEQIRLGQIGNGNTAMEFVNHTDLLGSYGIKFLVDVDHGASGLQIRYAPAATSYAALSYQTGLYMNLSGNVGIGTTSPDQKLTVNGTVHSKSVVVDLSIVPDYVFKPAYKLPSLDFVKNYIDKNSHLPEVPSEAEIKKSGLNVGEMNTILLKKVEELTLYLINEHKTNEALQGQVNELKAHMKLLPNTPNNKLKR
jgi:hypothetical protein